MLSVQQSQQSRLFWGNYKLSYPKWSPCSKVCSCWLERGGCGAVSSANKHAYQLVIILQPFFFGQGPGDNIVWPRLRQILARDSGVAKKPGFHDFLVFCFLVPWNRTHAEDGMTTDVQTVNTCVDCDGIIFPSRVFIPSYGDIHSIRERERPVFILVA